MFYVILIEAQDLDASVFLTFDTLLNLLNAFICFEYALLRFDALSVGSWPKCDPGPRGKKNFLPQPSPGEHGTVTSAKTNHTAAILQVHVSATTPFCTKQMSLMCSH